MQNKYLFVDRDGTLIQEPPVDYQVDRISKLVFEKDVVQALIKLKQADFRFVMVSNQDGLGTDSFLQEDFDLPHQFMMDIFQSQGIEFEDVLICPHFERDNCTCRKPKTELLSSYINGQKIDLQNSFMIGDRETDMQLAKNMGIQGIRYNPSDLNWLQIIQQLTTPNRTAQMTRTTNETSINIALNLDSDKKSQIKTGLYFFDHMLEQIASHAGFQLDIKVDGDLHVDDHHTIEDTALAFGSALKTALGSKMGIDRYGFSLPMDECAASCLLDLSGRPYLDYKAKFRFQKVGDLSTEMIEHFFYSLVTQLHCTLHLKTKGKNEHHKAESLFKVFGRTLRQAIKISGNTLPSTKGIL